MDWSKVHRNRATNEIVSSSIQICNVCFQNFASTRAGDRHRKGKYNLDKRQCLTGDEAGLEMTVNSFGATVYRIKIQKSD